MPDLKNPAEQLLVLLANAEKALRALLPGKGVAVTTEGESPKKRRMSASAIAKIQAAQKARWAKVKAGNTVVSTEAPAAKPAKKRKMSAAGIAKIRAGVKARWAKVAAAKEAAVATNAKAPAAKPSKKRKMSAAGKARIVAAVKARWAKVRAAKQPIAAATAVQKGKLAIVKPAKPKAKATKKTAPVAATPDKATGAAG